MNVQAKITKARTRVILNQPFFGNLVMKLPMVETHDVPTLATDGTQILYNPDYLDTLSLDQISGVICHEILHIAMQHHKRLDSRDPDLANQAMDYAINGILIADKIDLPPGALYDTRYKNKSFESIYTILQGGRQQQQQQQQVQDYGGCGSVTKPDPNQTKPDPITEIDVQQAIQSTQMTGKGSDNLNRAIRKICQPKVNWRNALQEFVTTTADDYSWSHPNRRYISDDLYLPGLYSESIGHIVIAIDTSGSLNDYMIAQFQSEINEIHATCQPAKLYVISCDSRIKNIQEFSPDDQIKIDPIGGGGTKFQPVFDYVADHHIDPLCLVYLTDMAASMPDQPNYPVLWISTTSDKASFGKTIHI